MNNLKSCILILILFAVTNNCFSNERFITVNVTLDEDYSNGLIFELTNHEDTSSICRFSSITVHFRDNDDVLSIIKEFSIKDIPLHPGEVKLIRVGSDFFSDVYENGGFFDSFGLDKTKDCSKFTGGNRTHRAHLDDISSLVKINPPSKSFLDNLNIKAINKPRNVMDFGRQ